MKADKQYKHIELFPEIINRKIFLQRKHPSLNPNTQEFIDYWREEKRKCIEGWWGEEKEGHWRWMFPKLYFYINHWKIQKIDPVNKARYYGYPDLTDVEWIFGAYHTAAIGFSGFTGDKKFTCNRLVQKWEQEKAGEKDEHGDLITLTQYEKQELMNNKWIKIPFGSFKKFVEPFEYLKLHHETALGYPLYENDPMNEFKMTSRGTGKSFWDTCIAGHEFTFDGAKYYQNELFPDVVDDEDRKMIGEVMIGASDPGKTFEFAKKVEYGLQNFAGAYVDAEKEYPPPFFKNYMGSLNVGETYKHRYKEYFEGGFRNVVGSIIYVTNYGSDAHAGASKRVSKQIVDEAAYIKNLDELHGVSKDSKRAGGTSFGNTSYSCTGGSFDKGEAAKRMFYNPLQFDIYPIKDYWENKGWIGLFIPTTYSDRNRKDENGNTIYEMVIEEKMIDRKKLSRSPNPLPLLQEKMNNPLVPSEMFFSTAQGIFNTAMCEETINELEEEGKWETLVSVGSMEFADVKRELVKWREERHRLKDVIRDLSVIEKADTTGVWTVYEHPDFANEEVKYRIVYDPYRNDVGSSYGSILVYKAYPTGDTRGRYSDDIVAEYIGRPNTVEDMHKQAVLAATYFKTKVLFERNVPGFQTYCRTNNFVHLLQPEPYEAVTEANKKRPRTISYGVHMNAGLKTHCINLLNNWLMTAWQSDEEGIIRKYNLHKIKSLRLLYELKEFGDPDGNFDHVSSALILMLWLSQDNLKPIDEKVQERVDEFDEFFKERVGHIYGMT